MWPKDLKKDKKKVLLKVVIGHMPLENNFNKSC